MSPRSLRTGLSVVFASIFVILVCPFSLVHGRDFFVDATNGGDFSGSGTRSNPWRSIAFALSQVSAPGSNVILAPGVYDASTGEIFPLVMKPGVSLLGSGFEVTRLVGTDVSDGDFCPTTSVVLDTSIQSVFHFSSFKIPAGVVVVARGPRPLEIFVAGNALIEGVLDLDGDDGEGGGSARPSPSEGGEPGAGGGRGGSSEDTARGESPFLNGGGQGGRSNSFVPGGGGGGGHSGLGGSERPANVLSGRGGEAYGTPEIVPLLAGSGGGGGGHATRTSPDHSGGGGGGGGGAVFLEVQGTLTIRGTIRCNGGFGGVGGQGSVGPGGAGGGGGSGGAIKLRADRVFLDGATLNAIGGVGGVSGGGAASPGGRGSDGRIRLETTDGLVDLGAATVRPVPSGGFVSLPFRADMVVFPGGVDFASDTRLVGVEIALGRIGIAVRATAGSSCRARVRGVAVRGCFTGILVEATALGVAAPVLVSNYIYDNGVGIDVQGDGLVAAAMTNETFVGNVSGLRVNPSFSGSDSSILQNSVLWNNGDDLEGASAAQVRDCDIGDGDFNGINGNLSVDPQFTDEAARNLRLAATSPVLDLGSSHALGLDGHDPDFEPRDFDGLGDGLRRPDLGADEAGDPRLLARYGSINAGRGLIPDVLFVNGKSGQSPSREVSVAIGAPVTVTIFSPPLGPASAPFALFASVLPPEDQLLSPLPLFLGTMAFEIGLVGPATGTVTLINTIPHPRARAVLGAPRVESIDAPAILLVPSGIGNAGAVTLQAIVVDLGAENGQAATTNAVVLRVE